MAWLAEPTGEVSSGGRRRAASLGAVVLLAGFVGWLWFSVDLDPGDLARESAVLAGIASGVSLVFLVLLLVADGIKESVWPAYRRASGVMVAGFGAAAASSLQIALVGEGWTGSGWLALAGFVTACGVVVLAQPDRGPRH